jgi:hypothetical protein
MNCYELLSDFAFKFNLRHYTMEERRVGAYVAGRREDYGFNGRIKYFPCRKGVYAPTAWDPALVGRCRLTLSSSRLQRLELSA